MPSAEYLRKQRRAALLKHATVIAVTAASTLGVVSLVGWLGSRCRCRYTPVIYAQRSGMNPLRLNVSVAGDDERRRFVSELEARGAFIDPDWKLGITQGKPMVYVLDEQRDSVKSLAASWRQR